MTPGNVVVCWLPFIGVMKVFNSFNERRNNADRQEAEVGSPAAKQDVLGHNLRREAAYAVKQAALHSVRENRRGLVKLCAQSSCASANGIGNLPQPVPHLL